jgi:hypothetical protein
MNFNEILSYGLENPTHGLAGLAAGAFTVIGLFRAIPVMMGFILGMLVSNTRGFITSFVNSTRKAVTRSKAQYPTTATECARYTPVKGHTFYWDKLKEQRQVEGVFKEAGQKMVRLRAANGKVFSMELGEFRQQIRDARGIVV